ncbi:hypothetical protein [Sporosarcina sp. SAFN-010]|uniref:hypothetical protein n=1 Tax=Sporosarcina sp. SAFN-010 TaxID=3387273 RepID=UPI003F7F3596
MIKLFAAAKKELILQDISRNKKHLDRKSFGAYTKRRSNDIENGQDFETILKKSIVQVSKRNDKFKNKSEGEQKNGY